MYAYSHILAALLQRGRSGRGCHIEVSMLESMVEWMSYPLYYAFDGASAAAARRRRARDDLSLRPVSHRRRQDGDARPAERTRVAGLLHQVLERPISPATRATLERPAHGGARRVAAADRRAASPASAPSN
jgi:crotonobetainyl-CoA:carnitine CoA-transferase CaiB-like acyl-CoA transferase